MNVVLPLVMFLVGFVAGGGIIWFLVRRSVSDACERERHIALANIRVAEERVTAKEARIDELQAGISQRDHKLQQRDEENVQLKQQEAALRTSLQKEQEKIAEKIELLNKAEKQFKDAFAALAADALTANNTAFNNLCNPVRETLNQINTKITVVNVSATNLGVETTKLVKALQKPEVRGQWGEMALERVLELTGMSEGRDFHRQQTIGDDDSQQRPDYVVYLPGDKHLAIDAKAPIRAFLEAAEATDEESQQAKLKEFVGHVRERIKKLASKAYHQSLSNSPEFVVLYLPTEAILSAALTLDVDLLENAFRQKVLVAGPTNLVSVLLAVAHGWKQEALAKNAREIAELGKELYKRLSDFGGHMSEVGHHLKKSTEAYNSAVGSLESRVMPQARRFEQLQVAPADKRIEELPPIETTPRRLQCDDFALEHNDDELIDADSLLRPR